MRGRVLRDDAQAVVGVGRSGQVALQQLDAGLHGMHVRVLEAGQQHPAAEVDDLGRGTGQLGEGAGLADREDRPAAHRDIPGPRALPART